MKDVFYSPEGGWEKILEMATEEHCDSGLRVTLKDGKAVIRCSKKAEFYRGIGWIGQWISEGRTEGLREETAGFKHLTYMIDCSRNAVPNIAFLKKLLSHMALMGYDRLMLYTEDTWEIEGRPFFGWMRGRYSKEELRELYEYAAGLGIELVPCIQTLAHLNAIFRWKAFAGIHDTADILSAGEEETYELIEDMIRTLSKTVRSRVINIGMDEAEMIGRGSFLNKYGYEERFSIMSRHLKRVLAICEKYGFTCMMWSDMFFKLISGEGYYAENVTVTDDIRAKIPRNVELVYWDYYSRDEKTYERMLKTHRELTPEAGFAGGAWKWSGFAPLLSHSILASRLALLACRKYQVKNVIVTGWGDDGGEAAQTCVLPLLSLYAESSYADRTDEAWLEKRLYACSGASLADFMKLELPNLTPDNPAPGRVSVGPAKYLLYQDALLGIYDRHVDENTYPAHFKETARILADAAKKGGPFACLFECLSALCAALEYKCDLGIKIRAAYLADDRTALAALAQRAKDTAKRTEAFQVSLKKQWFSENRAFGWEVQDIRLAGAAARLKSAAQRIDDYLTGRAAELEELLEDRLLLDDRKNGGFETLPLSDNNWKNMVTACVI